MSALQSRPPTSDTRVRVGCRAVTLAARIVRELGTRRLLCACLVVACLLAGIGTLPTRVGAATLTVMNLNDSGAGSLRQAILDAAPGDAIQFTTGLTGTITLTSGTLVLTQDVTITGPGAAVIAVDGNNTGSVFQVSQNVTASIGGLTIQHGNNAGSGGGGIINQPFATLMVTNATLTGNSASGVGGGGGIFNQLGATLTVTNSTLTGNTTGTLAASNGVGGGIRNQGTLTVTNTTLSGNLAGNNGGGISSNNGSVTVTNTTLSGNTAASNGIGDGGGGVFAGGGTITVLNTLLASNTGTPANCGTFGRGTITDVGHNLEFNPTTSCTAFGSTTVHADPLLAPLGAYGGPTQTVALLPGSAAIDAGITGGTVPATDQRGQSRVGAPEIGAFESQGFTLTPVTGSTPQSTIVTTPFAAPLALTVVPHNPGEPVDGGSVTFTAPTTGATATLSASTATIASGQASVSATANGTVGNYSVTASAAGATSVTFSLTNTPVTPVVTSTADGGTSIVNCAPGNANTCRLRDAIAAVNGGGASSSTITFAVSGTITLTSGVSSGILTLTANMTIDGTGATIAVDGNNAREVFAVNTEVTATISNLTIQHGLAAAGGGILNAGTLTVTNCTIANNAATVAGGAIDNQRGTLTVTNGTLVGNTSGDAGGGIITDNGTLVVTNSTLSGNAGRAGQGGGIANAGPTTLTNTIVANTTSGGDLFAISGTFSGTNNLIDDAASAGTFTDGVGGNIVGHPALLGTLGSYGGTTPTVPLLPGSPAIDAGLTGGSVPATDQRGKGRVNLPDIGAFESQGFALTAAGGTPQSTLVGTPFPAPLTVTLTATDPGVPLTGGAPVVLTFTVSPVGGAAASLSSGTATIGAGGQASVTATANLTVGGPYMVTATSTVAGVMGSAAFALTNTPPTITLSPTTLPNGVKGVAYPTTTLTATGGTAPSTFTVPPGTLPPGLTLASSGSLSGTPTVTGSFTFTVTATDAHGFTGSQQYTLTISAAPLVGIAVTPANGTMKVGAVVQYTATGTYADGTTADLTSAVTWSSDGTTVARVDASGKVLGLSPGSAHVTATQGSMSGQTSVTVSPGIPVGIAPAPAPASRPGSAGTTPPAGSPPPAPNPIPAGR